MIARATPELTALALAVREDWDGDQLTAAIATATAAGMPWPRLLLETVRLACDGKSSPRDLAALAADPRSRHEHDARAYQSGLAAAREAIRRPA